MSKKRPNFIVIMTDQHRADYLGCYGHPFLQTPALDGLAQRGTRFTRFYESYWLPEKFGFDTRKVQYSSLILTGQMSRDEALERLKSPAYDPETIAQDFEYIANKLGISGENLKSYLVAPNKTYKDYKNQQSLYKVGAKVMRLLRLELGGKR